MVTVMFCELNSNVNHISEKSEPLWLACHVTSACGHRFTEPLPDPEQFWFGTSLQNVCQSLNNSHGQP